MTYISVIVIVVPRNLEGLPTGAPGEKGAADSQRGQKGRHSEKEGGTTRTFWGGGVEGRAF